MKVDLVRPLSPAAQDVLAKLPRIGKAGYVFTTDGRSGLGGFSKFKRKLDKASGVTGWTLHDLRRTARSLMSRAGIPSDHAERCLGHVIGGVRGVYDRHEFHAEKKRAYEALAAQIERIVNPKDNVVPLRDARLPAADRSEPAANKRGITTTIQQWPRDGISEQRASGIEPGECSPARDGTTRSGIARSPERQ